MPVEVRRTLDPLQLELQVFVSHMWVLGTERRFSSRARSTPGGGGCLLLIYKTSLSMKVEVEWGRGEVEVGVGHTFNPNTSEAVAGPSLRPATQRPYVEKQNKQPQQNH